MLTNQSSRGQGLPPRGALVQQAADSAADGAKPDGQSHPISRELLSRARGGDAQSVGELLTLYRNYLTLLASTQLERRLQPRVSPSDVVQETLLRAHRHFADFRGATEQELLAWLRKILLSGLAHFVERHLLAAKRDIRKEVSLEDFAVASPRSSKMPDVLASSRYQSPSGEAQLREAKAEISQRLSQLAPRYREILELRNIDGLSFEEIATQMGRTPAAARMLWLRAIQKLRSIYRQGGEA